MKKIVGMTGVLLMSLTIAMTLIPSSLAVTSIETKTKTLSIAGEVTFTSSFTGAVNGETITITIWPVDSSVTINSVDLNKATPKPKSLNPTLTFITPGSAGGLTIDVTLTNDQGFKTFHLWLYLNTGEHIGVNVHF